VLSDAEFEVILNDETKRIVGDLTWEDDEDHSPSVEFRVDIESDAGYPLLLKATYNPLARTLSFTVIYRSAGRVYALDLGKDHRNPTGELVGDKHKHRWTEQYRDKWAYVPDDITAAPHEVIAVWTQFCLEAKIVHDGIMHAPPAFTDDMFT
jgi:hypothetical protein